MTKEEALYKTHKHIQGQGLKEKFVYQAMDICAEIEAIAFAEWIDKEIYTKGLNGKWYKIPGVPKGEQSQFTTQQLYNLFKQK